MKTIIITIFLGLAAHATVGILLYHSQTVDDIKAHNSQIELAVAGM